MKNKFIYVIIALGLLLAFQIKLVMPFVYRVVSSDLFLEDSGDEKNSISKNTMMTDSAFEQCNAYITKELYPDHSFTFSDSPLNAFKLGNFQYIINADADILPSNASSFVRKYVCRIQYLNKADLTGLSDLENWSVNGISGLDDI